MKLIEKLALEHTEKATHPEGDPHFRRAIKATWEAGFRKAREMALSLSIEMQDSRYFLEGYPKIRDMGEEEAYPIQLPGPEKA